MILMTLLAKKLNWRDGWGAVILRLGGRTGVWIKGQWNGIIKVDERKL